MHGLRQSSYMACLRQLSLNSYYKVYFLNSYGISYGRVSIAKSTNLEKDMDKIHFLESDDMMKKLGDFNHIKASTRRIQFTCDKSDS